MYSLEFNFASVALMLVIIWFNFYKKQMGVWKNTMFNFLSIINLLSTVFDILSSIGIANNTTAPSWFLHASTYGYFLFHNMVAFAYCLYTMAVLDIQMKRMTKPRRVLFLGPGILSLLVQFTTPITSGVFYFDEALQYHRGFLQPILYAVTFFYAVFGAGYCALYRHVITKRLKIALNAFVLIAFSAVLLQIFLPTLLIENLAVSICLLVMLLLIQRPEESMDVATGVLNRPAFDKSFRINQKSRTKNNIVLLYIRNEEKLSQLMGLDLLESIYKDVAAYLDKLCKNNVYYLHSNTFALLTDFSTIEERDALLAVAEARFQEPFICMKSKVRVQVSALSLFFPEDVKTLEQVYLYADCLRSSKSDAFVQRAEQFDLNKNQRRIEVSASVERAIQNNSFEMVYQPIYSVEQGKFTSAEALIRLNDELLGQVPPNEFIPLAEVEGTILKIGEIVFQKVFSFMSSFSFSDIGIDYVEINLSVVQGMQENLSDIIQNTIKKHAINPAQINLEITETAAVDLPVIFKRNMDALYQSGFTFSLDDFGTGYSNISTLMNLPLHIIKLDKSLIDMLSSERGKIVLGSSTAMVKQMNLKILAEGIETQAQYDALIALGVDYIQGYYFSKPLPEQDFLRFVENFNRNADLMQQPAQ